jgi:hypothetical protein
MFEVAGGAPGCLHGARLHMRLRADEKQKKRESGNKSKVTHPKLDSLHLCRTAIADNKAVRTERVITEDVLSERFSRTLGVRALFLGEEAVIPQVCCEQLSLARKLATGFSVQTFNGKLIYHLRGKLSCNQEIR